MYVRDSTLFVEKEDSGVVLEKIVEIKMVVREVSLNPKKKVYGVVSKSEMVMG